MRIINFSSLIFLCMSVMSCGMLDFTTALTDSTEIEIVSVPKGADVFIYSSDQEKYLKVGTTPFVLTKKTKLDFELPYDRPVTLIVEKAGHIPEHITIERKMKSKVHMALNLKAVEVWTDPTDIYSSNVVHDIGKRFQMIYRDIRLGKFSHAKSEVDSLLRRFPYAAILHDVKGSIFILEGQKEKAIMEYERSIQLRSDNTEARQALDILRN